MSELRDFELPESFIKEIRQGQTLTPETAALIQDVAEQTGLPVESVTNALVEEGLAAFRLKGILF